MIFDELNLVTGRIKKISDVDRAFEIIERVTSVFVQTVDVIVTLQDKAIVSIALKRGRKFIDIFNKLLPFVNKQFNMFKGELLFWLRIFMIKRANL